MRIQVVGSSVEPAAQQFAATYLLNDSIALDAGVIGLLPMPRQRRIQHVILSHGHLDHIGSLPLFLDNVFSPGPDAPTIYASAPVLEALQQDVFNDRVWPDLIRISKSEFPFFRLVELRAGEPVMIEGLKVTPVPLDHVVPTFGFVLDDGRSSIGHVSDTGPTQDIWDALNRQDNLKGVFLEAAFPDSFLWLAEKAKHLTPKLFGAEVQKLKRNVPIIAIHLKPSFSEKISDELNALGIRQLQIAASGQTFEF